MSVPSRCVCAGMINAIFAASSCFGGSLTPPAGPIAPTPGPEPRIAINATNTPGDADSVFKITQPGSYYLPGNVSGASGKRGIEIASSGVTIDLMGYRLQGAAGSLEGIATSGGLRTQLIVRNGTVSAWGTDGVNLAASGTGSDCTIENVHAITNGGAGLVAFDRAVIRGCVARGNGSAGIQATGEGAIEGCVASQNAVIGITVGASCSIVNCTARENGGLGISAATAAVISQCAAYQNSSTGIGTTSGANIRGCTSVDNGGTGISVGGGGTVQHCTASTNGQHGISFLSDCLIAWNSCDGNGTDTADGSGLSTTGSGSRIDSNHCTDNDYGVRITSSPNLVIRNTCSGNVLGNWNVAASNHIFVINALASPDAITTNAGGISFGSSDPNANFSGN